VEVLLLEEDTTNDKKGQAGKTNQPPRLRIVPEKPYIDCGSLEETRKRGVNVIIVQVAL